MEVHSILSGCIKFPLFLLLSITLLQVTEKRANHFSLGHSPLECHSAIKTGDCLDVIYHRYGSSGTIKYEQFKLFLGSIGLGGLGVVEHHMEEHEDHVGGHDNNEEEHDSHSEDTMYGDNHTTGAHLQKCLSPRSLLAAVDLEMTDALNVSHFLQLCPILLQQLDIHACTNTEEDHHHEIPSENHPTTEERHLREVWGFAIAAITVISLASITCILTVPCIQHYPVAFQRLLAFLIALAVGTLTGDAILHLIPHAFIPHNHDLRMEENHGDHGHGTSSSTSTEHLVILKGLAVLGGIFIFFLFEQILQYYSEKASIRRKKDYKSLPTDHDRINSKLSGHAALENPENLPMVCSTAETAENTPHKPSTSQAHPSSSIPIEQSTTKESSSFQYSGFNNPTGEHFVDHLDTKCKSRSEDVESVEENIPSEGHHHHGHSHVMVEGSGIASLAWVVVLGDAMHNFCDGLVVGSAFVDSLAGGLSTSIAIMCHEIPHELGDFAVMLKGGMSIKQALAFQGVSSVLAYIGMAVGLAVGNISSAATWMFALAAGMFLYIALVDLIPEMVDSTKSSKDSRILHLVLQTAGVVLGCSIMLVIALSEDKLLEILGG